METNANRILKSLAQSASNAAEEAKNVMQSAGKAVAEKYDIAMIQIELSRVRQEQEGVFANIGRYIYQINAGMDKDDEAMVSRKGIDDLLMVAAQKQQEIDALCDRQRELENTNVCPKCHRVCSDSDYFCCVCGTRLQNE